MFDFDTLIQDVIRDHDKHDTFLDNELDGVTLEHDDPTDYDIALGDADVVCPHTYAPTMSDAAAEYDDSLYGAIDRASDVE